MYKIKNLHKSGLRNQRVLKHALLKVFCHTFIK